jgi:hypothetical protein
MESSYVIIDEITIIHCLNCIFECINELGVLENLITPKLCNLNN